MVCACFVLCVQVKADWFLYMFSQGYRFGYPSGIHYFVGVLFVILILFNAVHQT